MRLKQIASRGILLDQHHKITPGQRYTRGGRGGQSNSNVSVCVCVLIHWRFASVKYTLHSV
jgi:hypothetical protein